MTRTRARAKATARGSGFSKHLLAAVNNNKVADADLIEERIHPPKRHELVGEVWTWVHEGAQVDELLLVSGRETERGRGVPCVGAGGEKIWVIEMRKRMV